MDIIGVIDVRRGQAVHAVAGARERYAPVAIAAGTPVHGDVAALAHVYVDLLGVQELYVADLDAIIDGPHQTQVVRDLAPAGRVWLDAAVTSVADARRAIALGVHRVVIGLETLSSWAAFGRIIRAVGRDRIAFSLDLRHGRPLGTPALASPDDRPASLAAHAAGAGAAAIIVLDVGRVGTGEGLDFELIRDVREAAPAVRLVAGGGVRGRNDLERLAAIGCDAALMATALHDGSLDAAGVAAARTLGHRSVSR